MSLFGSKMKKYDGAIGTFTYDPEQFKIYGGKNFAYLRYIGKETDGTKITIPEGITNCSRMFESSDIEIPPIIPDGVKICDRMFDLSKITEPPVFPDSVESKVDATKNCWYMRGYDGPMPNDAEIELEEPEKE